MKINGHGAAVMGVAAAATLLLAACGSDNNSGGSTASSQAAVQCATGSLNVAGSSAQQNAMSAWIKNYLGKCAGANITYTASGSGAGVQQFQQGTIDFAGSDFPLAAGTEQGAADARCKAGPAINVPMVAGGIAVGYNLPGVTSLNLSAGTLAQIFDGKIAKWNDPAIAKDNPGVTLPDLGVQTFHRSDGSGTTYNFTNYLANEAKADWTFGANKNWLAPGGQGGKGSSVVAQSVKSTPGGIGYFELSFATQNQIPFAKVSNAAGHFVELTAQNVTNFLGAATVVGTGNDLKLQFDYSNTDDNAYPNALVTYEIVCSKGNDPAKLPLVKDFLSYTASTDGQGIMVSQSYVPLPATLQSKVAGAVSSLG